MWDSITASVADSLTVQQICRTNVNPVTLQPPDLETYWTPRHPSTGNVEETSAHSRARLPCGECFRDDVSFKNVFFRHKRKTDSAP